MAPRRRSRRQVLATKGPEMRKIIVLNRISIDGYFASLNDLTFGMDWFVQDPEVDAAVHGGGPSDTLLMGAVTYKGFERSWLPMLSDPNTPPSLRAVADELTRMTKVVFSTRLQASDIHWDNTELHPGHAVEIATRLKSQPGTDMLIFGSGSLVRQLLEAALIDELLLIVTPVIAGAGKSFFRDAKQTVLTLLDAKSFKSGNVVLRYAVNH
jgi:dihydrofolate reductase